MSRIYLCLMEGDVVGSGYVSLRELCREMGISYNSAKRGRREFVVDGRVVYLRSVKVERIKGRGRF